MIRTLKISDKDKEVLKVLPCDPFIDSDDDFDYSRVVIEKPWGHEYSIYKNSDIDVWFLFLKPGHKTSTHCHPHKKTSLTVLSGEALVSTLEKKFTVRAGDGFLIEKGVFHSTEAVSPRGIYLLESETPVNKKNLVRFDDLYGRTGKRYESGRHVQPRKEDTAPSFYGAPHGTVRQMGLFEISLKKIGAGDTFAPIAPNAVGVVLAGSLCDAQGAAALSCGDVFNSDLLRQRGVAPLVGEVEVLLIECQKRLS